MAIYHCSLRTFSRSQGHSAVAAAAYRSGARLKDERTGAIHRYEKRKGVKSAFILAPHDVPEKFFTRAFLWNAAEGAETRKNSRVAREVILALPHELSDKARAELTRDMALYLIERYRVAVDTAIHSPCEGDGHDPRNHHAHLLFTTRELTDEGFGAKTRILDDKTAGPQEVEIIRAVWETLANDALERAGLADTTIDRRSLEAQGIDRIPQIHEGKAARNADAESPQSFLARDFKKADRGEDGDDGDEEDSDETGSGSGTTSGTDTQGSAPKNKPPEEVAEGKNDTEISNQDQTRPTFNDEIKELNDKRASFGEKPLREQIEQLDRMMAHLDLRLEKLQRIEQKTSLKSAIKNIISSAVKLAADTLDIRETTKAALSLSAEEKHVRAERQIARYGRTYRTGIHEQIREVKKNIALLEESRTAFHDYKNFVDRISAEIKQQAAFTKGDVIATDSVTAHFQEHNTLPDAAREKIAPGSRFLGKVLEAAKSILPEQETKPDSIADTELQQSTVFHSETAFIPPVKPAFEEKANPVFDVSPPVPKQNTRPQVKQVEQIVPTEKTATEPPKELTTLDTLQTEEIRRHERQVEVPAVTQAAPSEHLSSTPSSPPARAAFLRKADVPITPEKQASYKQEMPVRFKELDQVLAEKHAAKDSHVPPVKAEFSRKVDVAPTPEAQARYKQDMPIRLEGLEKNIAEKQAAKETKLPPSAKGDFTQKADIEPTPEAQARYKQEMPVRFAELDKVIAEKQAIKEPEIPEPESKPVAQTNFNKSAAAENKPQKSKPSMKNTFSQNSGAKTAAQSQPHHAPDEKPEVVI